MDQENPVKTTRVETRSKAANSLVAVDTPRAVPVRRGLWRLVLIGAIVAFAAVAVATVVIHQRAAIPIVAVETLKPGPVVKVLAVTGRTTADQLFRVESSVPGRVRSVTVSEGDLVVAGDILVELDSSQHDAAVRQAEASLEAARVSQAGAADAYARAQALGPNLPEADLEEAERALEAASAEVERQEAALEQARIAAQDDQIAAEIDGTVLDRSVEPGDIVAAGTLLLRLADLSRMHVEVEVDEIHSAVLEPGLRADLKLAGHDDVLAGEVTFVASEVDPVTGGFTVRIAFDEPPDAPIGLTTVANITIDRSDDALTIPRSALVPVAGGSGVYVLRDGVATAVPLTYDDWPAERVIVTAGLSDGERVVLNPDGLEDGQKVTAAEPDDAR